MEIELVPAPDDEVARHAVERAVAGEALAPGAGRLAASAWWRAGLVDALDRTPTARASEDRYDGAPPRSTRGATRA